jgi:electron-transferring-flavoprotein dehydrogenase
MAVAPAEFPPPFDPDKHIGPPTDPEDERLEAGVVIVGGGPAGLACANKVMQLLENEPELTEKLGEIPVAVLEKGKVCGAHNVSGANMRPSAMEELFPELDPEDWPVYQRVEKDAVYLLTKRLAIPLKPPPPNFRNHGNYVTSVSKLSRFLAERAEEAGAYILTETVADKLLVEDRIVRGVRSGDKGRGREGEERSNFEPGNDLLAKATVLAEGTLGHLTNVAIDHYELRFDPQRWEIGVKEVWEKGGRNRLGERLWISRRDRPPVPVTVSGTDFLAMPEAAGA